MLRQIQPWVWQVRHLRHIGLIIEHNSDAFNLQINGKNAWTDVVPMIEDHHLMTGQPASRRGGRQSASFWLVALGIGAVVCSTSWVACYAKWAEDTEASLILSAEHSEHASSPAPATAEVGLDSHGTAPAVDLAGPAAQLSPRDGDQGGARAEPALIVEDKEWKEFPRTARDVFRRLVNIPKGARADDANFSARMLFRNRELNKADTYIPKMDRQTLEIIVAKRLREIRESNDQLRKDFIRESSGLATVGRGVPLRPSPSLALGATSPHVADYVADEPFDVLIGTPSGQVMGARIETMPDTMEGAKWVVFQQQCLAAECLSWFHERGLIGNAEYMMMMERVFSQSLFNVRSLF